VGGHSLFHQVRHGALRPVAGSQLVVVEAQVQDVLGQVGVERQGTGGRPVLNGFDEGLDLVEAVGWTGWLGGFQLVPLSLGARRQDYAI
jgi:hypothetical protein